MQDKDVQSAMLRLKRIKGGLKRTVILTLAVAVLVCVAARSEVRRTEYIASRFFRGMMRDIYDDSLSFKRAARAAMEAALQEADFFIKHLWPSSSSRGNEVSFMISLILNRETVPVSKVNISAGLAEIVRFSEAFSRLTQTMFGGYCFDIPERRAPRQRAEITFSAEEYAELMDDYEAERTAVLEKTFWNLRRLTYSCM